MEVNFYEMYLEEMALIPVLEAEEEKRYWLLLQKEIKRQKSAWLKVIWQKQPRW